MTSAVAYGVEDEQMALKGEVRLTLKLEPEVKPTEGKVVLMLVLELEV